MNSPNQLSFLPDDYLERRARQRSNLIFALLFLVVAAAIVGAFVFDERETRHRARLDAQIDQQYEEAARRIEQVRHMQEKQQRMAQQAELAASLLEKIPRSFILAEITNSLPEGVSLLDMGMDSRRRVTAAPPPRSALEQRREATREAPSSPAPPEPLQYDVTLKLTGVADTDVQVAQFMNRMQRSPLLQEVNLISTEQFQLQGQNLRKFQMDMRLHPNADVQAQAPAQLRGRTVRLELD